MSNETAVKIQPDSAATGAHSVRTESATPSSTGTAVEQQVVTLADQDGNLLDFVRGAHLPVHSDEITDLLRAICIRLDILNSAVQANYNPPDNLPYEDA